MCTTSVPLCGAHTSQSSGHLAAPPLVHKKPHREAAWRPVRPNEPSTLPAAAALVTALATAAVPVTAATARRQVIGTVTSQRLGRPGPAPAPPK